MATGALTYEGLAVPLLGESEIIQQTAADDILTITGKDTQTGDFIVCRDSSKTEHLVVQSDGNIVVTQEAAGTVGLKILRASGPTSHAIKVADNGDGTTKQWAITKNYGMLMRIFTTKPTTGLTKGEVILLMHTSTPKLGVVFNTSNGIKFIRLKTKTFGRLTA